MFNGLQLKNMKVKDIAQLIETVAPLQLQEGYDNAGLQIGDPEQEVTGILTTLDVTEDTISEALSLGVNLIVSHHPLLFRGVKQINPKRDYISRVLMKAIKADIAIYSAHTNLDNAPRGVNYRIGQELGLQDIRPLAPLPESQTIGLDSSFSVQCGSGIVGILPSAMKASQLVDLIKSRFHIDALMANVEEADLHRQVRTIALCGGAGDDFIPNALRAKADVFLTGEVSYHLYFGHPELLILCGGHYETEQFTSHLLRNLILECYSDAFVQVARKSSPIVVL